MDFNTSKLSTLYIISFRKTVLKKETMESY